MIQNLLTTSGAGKEDGIVMVGVPSMDDAAVIRVSDSSYMAIASDFVRGTGFYLAELGHMTTSDAAYYLVAANVSDIAAMGVRTNGITLVYRYHKDTEDEKFMSFFKGAVQACNDFDIKIVGGDTGSYSEDVFSATAFGLFEGNKALLRSGAKVGDDLYVSGTIGLPITAISYFVKAVELGFKVSDEYEKEMLSRWKRPSPRTDLGVALRKRDLATSCMDVSDGLRASIDQIGSLSDAAFELDESKLPIHQVTRDVAEFLESDPVNLAMSASVDFELLFTSPRRNRTAVAELSSELGLAVTRIGECVTGRDSYLNSHGHKSPLPGIPWRHQEGDYLSGILNQ